MTKAKVFVTRKLPESAEEFVTEHCEADLWQSDLPPSRTELLSHVRDVEGILSLLTDRIDSEVMDAAGANLKVISNCAVGVDNIDIPEATKRGIPIGNTPGILTETTADFAFALLMAAARRIVEADRYVRDGHWKTWGLTLLLGQDIHGGTLGIIGFGRIGQALARRASGFNMRILYYDPHAPRDQTFQGFEAQSVNLEILLQEADFISLHTPLTEETRGLIDASALRMMKSSAVLINTARGPVVDATALYEALTNGEIAYAALDVTDPEPISSDSPLLELENIILAPHIASASSTTRTRMAQMAAENLIAGLRGDPLPFCVNPEVY
jgi:glyoxylate reductase